MNRVTVSGEDVCGEGLCEGSLSEPRVSGTSVVQYDGKKWRARQDSNPRPSDPKSDALIH